MRPDRIDFTILEDDRINVLKLRRDTTDPAAPRDTPLPDGHEIKSADFDLEAALAWCESNGYTVRRWPGGARAWKGEPWVIRTGWQIVKLRRKLEARWRTEFRRNPGRWSSFDTLLSLDLAYDG
jgi:hypothetical protein